MSDLLLAHVNPLTGELNLSLKRLSSGGAHPGGLFTLLRTVLRLRNVGDHPGLRNTLEALLRQLDFSWTEPKSDRTALILRTVLIFVESFEDKKLEGVEEVCEIAKAEARNAERGAMTAFVKSE